MAGNPLTAMRINHDKYFELINLIENKDSKDLINCQILDTLKIIQKILLDKSIEESKAKIYPKILVIGLGKLGKLTVVINKPILAKDLWNGNWNVFIQFITKIFEYT